TYPANVLWHESQEISRGKGSERDKEGKKSDHSCVRTEVVTAVSTRSPVMQGRPKERLVEIAFVVRVPKSSSGRPLLTEGLRKERVARRALPLFSSKQLLGVALWETPTPTLLHVRVNDKSARRRVPTPA